MGIHEPSKLIYIQLCGFFIARLAENCNAIAEVMGSNPVGRQGCLLVIYRISHHALRAGVRLWLVIIEPPEFFRGGSLFPYVYNLHFKYIEDITWPRGDTNFIFEC